MAKAKGILEDVVRCKCIELVDDKGRVRLKAWADDECTHLDLYGGRGKERLELTTLDISGSSEILMQRANGDTFVSLWAPVFNKRPPIVPEELQEFIDDAMIVLQVNGKDALTVRQLVKAAALEILQQKRRELSG